MIQKFKPKKYRIYIRRKKYYWKPTKFTIKGWRKTKQFLDKLKSRGIKAYGKKYSKINNKGVLSINK